MLNLKNWSKRSKTVGQKNLVKKIWFNKKLDKKKFGVKKNG